MRRTMNAVMVALTVGGGLFTGTAHAQEAIEIQASARCAGSGEVYPIVGDLTVRRTPDRSSAPIATLQRGVRYGCWPVVAGGRYDLCGVSRANGWIAIDIDSDGVQEGYSASTCLRDA